jgi:Protein of unknown function (DUF2971)
LQGIISSKSLWATDYRFLNDRSEFRYGWKLLIDAIDRRESDIRARSSHAWDTIALFVRTTDKANAFVVSLTSKGDLLSQWRGYNHGRGFAIGFDDGWLRHNASVQDFDISSVIYEPNDQIAAADTTVDLLVEGLARAHPTYVLELLNIWRIQAVKTALRLKDRHFSEEQESRLVWAGHSWPMHLKTRISPAGLVPYEAFQLDLGALKNSVLHPQNVGIEEIIVGPALGEHQVRAVDALLASNHMRLTIKRSAIPYVAD